MMKLKEMFEKGMMGRVIYDDVEDSYQLEQRYMNIGLFPIWEEFEGKKVKITIQVLGDDE